MQGIFLWGAAMSGRMYMSGCCGLSVTEGCVRVQQIERTRQLSALLNVASSSELKWKVC